MLTLDDESTPEFLARLGAEGVEIWREGNQLRYRASGGAPTPATLAAIRDRRQEILNLLGGTPAGAGGLTHGRNLPDGDPQDLPLDMGQMGFLMLELAFPRNPYSNVFSAFQMRGQLNARHLRRGLREVVGRHSALRTTIRMSESDGPRQIVGSDPVLGWEAQDLTGMDARKRVAECTGRIIREALKPFDLAHGPLLRAVLLRLASEQHLFLLTVHHIISDNWSIGIVLGEMGASYEASTSGAPSPLTAWPRQYSDFSTARATALAEGRFAAQLSYWQKRLNGGRLPPLQLAPHRPAGVGHDYATFAREIRIPVSLTGALRRFGESEGCTIFMTMLSVVAAALGQISGADEARVATLVADRKDPGAESIVGPLINTVIIRISLLGDPSARDILARTRETVLEAVDNQDLPFGAVLDHLERHGTLARESLCPVLFNFGTPHPSLRMGEVEVEAVDVGKGLLEAGVDFHAVSGFDLVVTVAERFGEVTGSLVFKRSRFSPAAADALADRIHHLAAVMVAGSGDRLSCL
jgi:hypothetical protein